MEEYLTSDEDVEEYVTDSVNLEHVKNYTHAMIVPLESNGVVCVNNEFYAFFKFSWIGKTSDIKSIVQRGLCKVRLGK